MIGFQRVENKDRDGYKTYAVQNELVQHDEQAGIWYSTDSSDLPTQKLPELVQVVLTYAHTVWQTDQRWLTDGYRTDTKLHGLAVAMNNRAGERLLEVTAQQIRSYAGKP